MLLHASQISGGITPSRIKPANIWQPIKNAKIDSRPAATIMSPSKAWVAIGNPRAKTPTAAVVTTDPIPCAKRFGGPGTSLGIPRRGATSLVATWPEPSVADGETQHQSDRTQQQDTAGDGASRLLVDRVREPMIFRLASFDASTPTDIVCLPCRNSCHAIAYCRLHAGGVICEDDHQPRRIRETSFLLGFHRGKVAAEMTDYVTCVSLDAVDEGGLAPA
jgi:hypothetical protein